MDNKEKSKPSHPPLIRDKYRDQFNKAMEIVSDNIKKGIKKKNILALFLVKMIFYEFIMINFGDIQ